MRQLADQAVFHTITREDVFRRHDSKISALKSPEKISLWNVEDSISPEYPLVKFQGIIPDTGDAGVSTEGHPQVMPYRNLILA